MGTQTQLTQTRLSILRSLEDRIDLHKRDNPDSDVPGGAGDAVGFLLDFYEQIQGWEFNSVKRISERYNQDLIEKRRQNMSCDYAS